MSSERDELISVIVSLGFPRELGVLAARHLGHPKAIERLTAYLRYTRPTDPREIADEMLAIREEIDRWRDKKRSQEANSAYNELLWYGLEED
jgi:hypothetical protein